MRAAAAFGLLIVGASASIGLRTYHAPRSAALHVTPLTTYRGAELFPAVSPDGRSIAFTWTGVNDRQVDLYARPLEGEPPVQLTNDPELECYPSWSPDGKLIAFLHCSGYMGGIRTEAEVYVVPASGGPKRLVGKILAQAYDNVNSLAWMPNGQELIVRNRPHDDAQIGLASMNVANGAIRQLTSPTETYDDASPAVSHDGRLLAFVRQTAAMRGDIFVQEFNAPAPAARQITHEQHRIYGVAWRSAKELIYLSEEGTTRTLWKINIDTLQREPLSGAGQVGVHFCLFRDGRRLIYSDAYIDTDIYRVDLSHAKVGRPLAGETLIASTQWDGGPDYSSDGRKIAFASARSGYHEIWMADADGANPTQLSNLQQYTGAPRWSPNGNEIAVDSQKGDSTHIYVIDVASKTARRLTSESGRNYLPRWSRDGNWLYFVSDRNDGYQVWKTRAHQQAGNEQAIQITRHGGFAGYESVDGKRFYYAKTSGLTCIWTVPADGGEESEVVCPLISWEYISLFKDGFYYAPQTSRQIWFFSFSDHKSRRVFDLKGGAGGTFTFSPDRRWLLITAADLHRGDLHLIDNLDQ
jgi:Tol biopolymer transport system component